MSDDTRAAQRRRLQFHGSTVWVFLALAVVLWLNAAINHYRFNVVLAVVASVPLLVLLVLGAAKARTTPA